jgi:hypothetical protein
MESKTKIKSNEKPKTKRQIEEDHPFIKPEDCPGKVIEWVVKRDEKLFERIEEIIDGLFDKHFKKYITMIFWNRVFVILLAVGLSVLWGVVLYHFYT